MSDIEIVHGSDAIGHLRLGRTPVNAVAMDTYRAIIAGIEELAGSGTNHAIIISSDIPGYFCAGADIKELRGILAEDSGATDTVRQQLAHQVYDTVLNAAVPTICVVNGHALGAGAALAATSDIRIGTPQARIGVPEIKVGRCGGGRHLMRVLPQGTVRKMYFTGESIDAQEAYRLGFFDSVVPEDEAIDVARDLARRIVRNSPTALRMAKEALNGCEDLPIAEGYALEQRYTLELGKTPDAQEAVAAFLEKREPHWAPLT